LVPPAVKVLAVDGKVVEEVDGSTTCAAIPRWLDERTFIYLAEGQLRKHQLFSTPDETLVANVETFALSPCRTRLVVGAKGKYRLVTLGNLDSTPLAAPAKLVNNYATSHLCFLDDHTILFKHRSSAIQLIGAGTYAWNLDTGLAKRLSEVRLAAMQVCSWRASPVEASPSMTEPRAPSGPPNNERGTSNSQRGARGSK
jgi:hypothetical protein